MSDHQQDDNQEEAVPPPSVVSQEEQEEDTVVDKDPSSAAPPVVDDKPPLPRPSSDSQISSSNKNILPWKCTVCDYEHEDATLTKCAYCGSGKTATSPPPPPSSIPSVSPTDSKLNLRVSRTEDPGVQEPPFSQEALHSTTTTTTTAVPAMTASRSSSRDDDEEEQTDAVELPPVKRSSNNTLLSSLRDTVESVSERLLELEVAQRAEDGFDDSGILEGSSSAFLTTGSAGGGGQTSDVRASAMTVPTSNVGHLAPKIVGSNAAANATTEIHPTTPVMGQAADNISLEEMFAGQQQHQLPKIPTHLSVGVSDPEEQKQPETSDDNNRIVLETPQSPPFEAMPVSPQRQPKPTHVEPWEMPPITPPPHIPDLTGAMFSATPTKKQGQNADDTDASVEPVPPAQRMIRMTVMCVVVLIIVLSVILVKDRDPEDSSINSGSGVLVSRSPVSVPTTPPSNLRPTSSPQPMSVDFTVEAELAGSAMGSRLGTVVAMATDATVLAALDSMGMVQVYRNNNNGAWESLPSVPVVEDDNLIEDMDLQVVGNVPMLAVASSGSVRVWALDTTFQEWIARGQLEWNSTTGVTAPRVSLSATGESVATGHIEQGGMEVVVQVWQWNDIVWEPLGEAITKSTTTPSPFQLLSLDLSSANIVAVADWRIQDEAVSVETYQWNAGAWEPRGSPQVFSWGPSDVSLTHDGNYLAVATPTPGSSRVYSWNIDLQDWDSVGGDLLGGSSIALSNNGQRVIVGSPVGSTVIVYDWMEEWQATKTLSGAIGDQFGSAVALAGDGNTIVVGAPLEDAGEVNAGKALVYT